jgi:hypothetical protein
MGKRVPMVHFRTKVKDCRSDCGGLLLCGGTAGSEPRFMYFFLKNTLCFGEFADISIRRISG